MKKIMKKRRREAFTLIELMVVVMILAVLMVAIVPNVVGKSDKAKQTKAQADIATIEGFLDEFYLDMGRYPTTEEGLRVLFYAPSEGQEKWRGPYPKKPISKDPWGNPYLYECPSTHSPLPYEVLSYGRDGAAGGEEYDKDLTNYAEFEENAE